MANQTNQAVYGIAKNRFQAEKIVQALINSTIPQINISFLSQQSEEFEEFSQEPTSETRNWRTEERLTNFSRDTTSNEQYPITNANYSTKSPRQDKTKKNGSTSSGGLGTEKHSKAPEGATTGGTTGGIIGGALGLLAGIGALAIPGVGPFIAAGPLLATLAGIGVGGTIGGIIGALVGAGIPEYEAKRYKDRLTQGGVLIAVRTNSDDMAKKVKDIMQKNGAEDVTISSEAASSKNNRR